VGKRNTVATVRENADKHDKNDKKNNEETPAETKGDSKDKSKSRRTVCPVVASVHTDQSRAVPVLHVLATIQGRRFRMGIDTMACVSCCPRDQLTDEQYELAVATRERLTHAGGSALCAPLEVTLPVRLGKVDYAITFNIIECNGDGPGWLLGMDFLEKYDAEIGCAARRVSLRDTPIDDEDLVEYRGRKEAALAAGLISAITEHVDLAPQPAITWGDTPGIDEPFNECEYYSDADSLPSLADESDSDDDDGGHDAHTDADMADHAGHDASPSPSSSSDDEDEPATDPPANAYDGGPPHVAPAAAPPEMTSSRVIMGQHIVIPPRTKTMITGIFACNDFDQDEDLVYLPQDPDEEVKRRSAQLVFLPGLTKGRRDDDPSSACVPIHVFNVTNKPLALKKNAVVGSVQRKARVLGTDTYLLRDVYVDWLENQLGISKAKLEEAFFLDADYTKSKWTAKSLWLNPPWELLNETVAKLLLEVPEQFVVLGPRSNKEWCTTLRAMGCKEVVLPKTFGPGFFTQLQSDGTYKELRFPFWDLVAFQGTKRNIIAYNVDLAKSGATAPVCSVSSPPPPPAPPDAADAANATNDNAHAYLDVSYGPDLTPEQLAEAKALISEYSDVFDLSKIVGRIPGVECHLDTGDHAPLSQQPFQVSPARRAKIDAKLDMMLGMGIIRESESPWASRFFLVPQPGREDREVVDYRPLNGITKPDLYPLPRIDDTLMMLQGLEYVSTFDGSKGFWQIAMAKDSIAKTAFITHRGLYEFTGMPFGLKNAPGVFQRMMDTTFAGLKWLICLVYLDDVVVWASTWDEHLSRVRRVLQRCRERNLGLKAKKSFVGFNELRILGHTVNNEGRFPDDKKVVAISALADPKNKAELACFLGMTGFYAEYIKDYAGIAAPLNELRKKDVPFVWTNECKLAVQKLKAALVSPSILVHPNYDREFIVMPDASLFAVGGVLVQHDDKGKERPVSYRSKKLNPAERKYAVYELEALAVVYAVRKFRPYIEGRHFLLLTDHNALVWLFRQPNLKGKLARWALELQQLDFTIRHRPGKIHIIPDAISRLPRVDNDDNNDEQFLPADEVSDKAAEVQTKRKTPPDTTIDELIKSIAAIMPVISTINDDFGQVSAEQLVPAALVNGLSYVDTSKGHCADEARALSVIAVIDIPSNAELIDYQKHCRGTAPTRRYVEGGKQGTLTASGTLPKHARDLELRDDVLVHVDPNNAAIVGKIIPYAVRPRVLQYFHEGPGVQHLGYAKILDKMKHAVWWPGMETDLRRLCAACLGCRQKQNGRPANVRPLQPVVSSYPNEVVSLDLFGPFLKTSKGNTYCEVATCLFTKFIMLRAVKDSKGHASAETLVQWTTRYGAPTRTLTDRGPNYTAEVLRETARLLGVNKIFTTAGNHQGNGQSERLIRTITQMFLASWEHEQEWDSRLHLYEYAYNVSWHPAIKDVPWALWFSRMPPPLIELEQSGDNRVGAWRYADRRAYAKDTLNNLLETVRRVRDVHRQVKAQMKERHDNAIRHFVNLSVGDLCYWYDEHTPVRSEQLPARRLFGHWKGPFFVTDIKGQNATIMNATTLDEKTVHRNLLRRYVYPLAGLEPEGHRRGAYVDRVVGVRGNRHQVEYEVIWKSKDGEDKSWLPEELTPANLVEAFNASRPTTSRSTSSGSAPRPSRA
jgi:transposase InsO family protein